MTLLFIVFLTYFSLGLPDSLTGVAWPNARVEFGAAASMAGYFSMSTTFFSVVSSLLSIKLRKKFSAGTIAAASTLLTSVGIICGAAIQNQWQYFLITMPMGLGAGAIDTVVNDYVSKRFSSRVMSCLHAFWGIGALISPLIVTACINLSDWRTGFLVIGIVQLILSVILFVAAPLWNKPFPKTGGASVTEDEIVPTAPDITMRHFAPYISGLIFFFYLGFEGGIGTWLKTMLYDGRGVGNTPAGVAVALYYAAIAGGRLVFGLFSHKLGAHRSIFVGIGIAAAGVALFFADNYALTVAAVLLIGIGASSIYPMLMYLTPRRFNKTTSSNTMAIQQSLAYLGVLIFNPLFGLIGNGDGMRALPVFAALCFAATVGLIVTLDGMTKMTIRSK